jgi:hypothetical protein
VWSWVLPASAAVFRSPGDPFFRANLPSLTLSPDGTRLAVVTLGLGGRFHGNVLDAETGAVRRDFHGPPSKAATLPGYVDPPFGVGIGAFLQVTVGPAGQLMANEGHDIVVWDGTNPEGRRIGGHDVEATAGIFSADGRRLFTADGWPHSGKRVIRVWDLATGRELLAIREPPASGRSGPGWGSVSNPESMWLDGDRLMLLTQGGVLVFDGTPRAK